MTWLVTGGAGYIGSHVVRAFAEAGMASVVLDDLSSGHREFVDETVPFVQGSVLDRDLVRTVLRDLIGALSSSLRHRINQSELRVNELPLEVVRQRAIEAAREAVALLMARGAVDELPPYGAWIMDVASQVSAASKENGGLGAGARVQPAESSLLDDLKRALEPGAANG